MVSTSVVRALMVALTVSAPAQASWFAGAAEAGEMALAARQLDILSSASTATGETTPTTVSPTPSTTPTSPSAVETTSAVTTPTTPPVATTTTPTIVTTPTTAPTTNATPTVVPSTTTFGTTTRPFTSQTTPPPGSSASSATPTQFTESEVTFFSTKIITLDNGSTSASVTAIPTKTSVPLASGGDQNDQQTQEKNKQIIIGVCVGVGGAIVLAVAGVLFWRLRNKRRQEVDHDELQSFGTSYGAGYGAPSTAEKSETGAANSARSPFQSTLESYHAPTQANTASNF